MPSSSQSRRNALKCLAYGGAGTLFTLAGGIFTPVDLAIAAGAANGPAVSGKPRGSCDFPPPRGARRFSIASRRTRKRPFWRMS